ncbi:hypothetical protein LXN79_10785, partial [Escherichia coli]|nr:hypothetical protein [Escherichia coli]
MDLENKFSYHFLEGLTLTEDGILTQGNEQVYIPQKELGVLIVLLESAGHVVLKDMIIESVWKNIIVSDESLTRCIGNDSNLLIVFYVQIMPDDFVMQLHR